MFTNIYDMIDYLHFTSKDSYIELTRIDKDTVRLVKYSKYNKVLYDDYFIITSFSHKMELENIFDKIKQNKF